MVSHTSVRRNVIHPYRQAAILLGNSNPFLALHISPADPSAYSSLDVNSQVLTDKTGFDLHLQDLLRTLLCRA